MTSLLAPDSPTVAIEIAPRRVTAVSVVKRGRRPSVAGHATEILPEGMVIPTMTAINIPNPGPLTDAVRRALQRAAGRSTRVALAIPDSLAKVSFVRFEKVPPREEDLAQLVRWQIRKTAPFRIEDAQVSFVPGAVVPGGGREYVVVLARRDIIQEYERICTGAGAHAGLVNLASVNLLNLVLASEAVAPSQNSDWLLVHVNSDYATIAILRAGQLVFFRNLREEAEGSLADFVHQTAMYYEDRLSGRGFARVILAGASEAGTSIADGEELRRALEKRLGAHVEMVDPRSAVDLQDRVAAAPELLDALASPVGLLLRAAAA